MNETISTEKKRSQLEQTRQIIWARQLQKLADIDSPVFLAIVKPNDPLNKREEKRQKQSHNREVKFIAAHGLTEVRKRLMNKALAQRKI